MDRETLPTLEELAAFARAPSRGDGAAHYRQILERLAAHPRDSKALLEELLLSRDIDTRAWAAMAGTRVFGKEFERVLVRLLDDKTSEMQSLALGLLENLDPGALEPLLPKLRRKLLHSKDEDDVVQVMWALARLGDVGALPAVNALASRPEPYVRKMADVLATYLEDGEPSVVRRLAEHDHDHTVALCRLAWHLGSQEALKAMLSCAATAPDDDCGKTCARFARSLQSMRARGEPPFWGESAPE